MRFFGLFLFVSSQLASLEVEYGISGKKEGDIPITHVQILGERCSGTNYLQALLAKNFQFDPYYFSFGSKHFPVWLKGDWFQNVLAQYGKNHFARENGHCLFIIIFRNPYDWLQSLCEKPYHTSHRFNEIVQKDFSRFIRTTWEVERHKAAIESNPKTGAPFRNIMRLRTARIRNMLSIAEIVDNAYCIQYEVLRDHPEEVMAEIANVFGVEPAGPFMPVTEQYKATRVTGKKFQVKEYPKISKKDVLYINKHLDADLEKKIGYTLADL